MVATTTDAPQLAGQLTGRQGFEVYQATDADRPAILALIEEMIPGVDAGARWRWLYETNPAGRALTWLALAPTARSPACTSFSRSGCGSTASRCSRALGGDGYVRPAFRRRGLGGLLHDASRRAHAAHRHRLHVRRARRDERDAAQARRLARGRHGRALRPAAARLGVPVLGRVLGAA